MDLDKIFDFFQEINKLKETYRYSEVPNMPKESSASHSWRLSVMVSLIAEELNLDIVGFML
jgi:5'-deoxynucleotidase YfbR-like HD superfamily hydrolase